MKRLSRPLAVAGYVAGVGLMTLGGVVLTQSPSAAVTIDNGAPGVLRLEATSFPAKAQALAPGDSVQMSVTTVLDVAKTGALSLEIQRSGGLAEDPQGAVLVLEMCEDPWAGSPLACAASRTIVSSPLAQIQQGQKYDLGLIAQNSGPYFLATVSLPETVPSSLQGQRAEFSLGFTAFGDDAVVALNPIPGPSSSNSNNPSGSTTSSGSTDPNNPGRAGLAGSASSSGSGAAGLAQTGLNLVGGISVALGLVVCGLIFARQRAVGGVR